MNTKHKVQTFGEYLAHNVSDGIIDFSIRAEISQSDPNLVSFYIHPANVSGETEDFLVGVSGSTSAHVENRKLINRLVEMTRNVKKT